MPIRFSRSLSKILMLASLFIPLGCSGDSDDKDATPADGTTYSGESASEVVAAAKSKINGSLLLADSAANLRGTNRIALLANDDWTAASLSTQGGDGCDAMTSPKGHIQALQDDECTTSPIFDLNNLLDILCAITNTIEDDESGLPAVGSAEPEISEAVATECGIPDAVGFSMPTEVEAVSDNDAYQRKVVVTTGSTRTMYMGRNGDVSTISFMYGDSSTYRGFYAYDSSSKQMSFELQARSTDSGLVSFFRIFRDESEAAAEVKLVGSYKDDGSDDNVRWTFYGDASGSNDIAVSMVWAGQNSGNGLDTCVDPSDFTADGTSSACGDFTAPSASSFGTFMENVQAEISAMDDTEFQANFDEDDVVDFNDETIISADFVN